MSEPDGFEKDFTVDLADPILALLMRGIGRRETAERLGVPLKDVHVYVADAVRKLGGEKGTPREARAMLHLGLDDVTSRAYLALDQATIATDRAALLDVLLNALRLRAALLPADRQATGE